MIDTYVSLTTPEPVLIAPVVTWPGAPTPEGVVAVALQDLRDQLAATPTLPAQVGTMPEFDTAFDAQVEAGRAVSFVQAPEIDALAADLSFLDRIAQRAGGP